MTAQSVIAGDPILGVLLIVFIVLLLWRNQSFVREIAVHQGRGWRTIARMSFVAIVGLIAWVSAFDNWRQLTALPFHATRQWDYQRVQIDPPSDQVRAMTGILLAVALVITACMVARHLGGYFLQLVLTFGAISAWLPFFVIRQRLSLDLAMGFTGSWSSVNDVVAYLGYVAIAWGFDLALIVISFIALLAIVSLPVTLVLDLLRLRRPKITTEAQPFFAAIGHRVAR
jgi:hypothetical protein